MLQTSKVGLHARLAKNNCEIMAAQKLRYKVFYQEFGAKPTDSARFEQLDKDPYDTFCEHVLVISQNITSKTPILLDGGELVGVYRLLPQKRAQENFGFYTQNEFDIDALIVKKPNQKFLELGRSCIRRKFRSKPVLELLWQVVWNYVRQNDIDVLFGCASSRGTSIAQFQDCLTLLQQDFLAPEEWQVQACALSRIELQANKNLSPSQKHTAFRQLPNLLRSYLKVGACVSKQAVVDHQFNSIDLLVILPVINIKQKYFTRFGKPKYKRT